MYRNRANRCRIDVSKLEFRRNYKKGLLYGIWEKYDEEGNLTKTLTYKDGEVGYGWLANFTESARARSTFICFLMILIQGIGQTIYQQVVRLIEVGQ